MTSCVHTMPLSSLLDKHAPIITKSGSHSNKPWYTSYLQAFKSFQRRLERTYKRSRDPQLLSELKSATNRYHHLLATAKKKLYSSLVHSFIHSFIHYGDLYSAPSRLLLRSA